MFLIKIQDKEEKLQEIIDRENLAKYARRLPFRFNEKKYYMWEYFKMKNLEGGYLKISFFNFLQENQKGFAYNLLSCFIACYNIPTIGIEVAINVDQMFQKELGDVVYEKILFPYAVNMWDYSTMQKNIEIDVPGKLVERILLLQSRLIVKHGIDYTPMIIPTRQISSLILKL